MRITAGDKTVNRLIDEGWNVSHSATTLQYKYAGVVSTMRSRNGKEYCRVHQGKTVNMRAYGHMFTFQMTTVMCREITK